MLPTKPAFWWLDLEIVQLTTHPKIILASMNHTFDRMRQDSWFAADALQLVWCDSCDCGAESLGCFDWTRIEGKILLFRRRWHRWLPLSREKRLPCSKINFTSPFYATHQSVFFVCQFQNFHCSQYPVCPFTLGQAPINTKGSAPQFAICLWRRMFAICRGFLCFHAPAVFVFN